MAKRFAYVSFGILCLMVAYQMGAGDARADWDMSASGSVVGGDLFYWYSSSGEAWSIGMSGWTRAPAGDLPVSTSDVKFIGRDCCSGSLVTNDDVGWYWESQVWTNVGPFPGGPVSVEAKSFGDVKARFR